MDRGKGSGGSLTRPVLSLDNPSWPLRLRAPACTFPARYPIVSPARFWARVFSKSEIPLEVVVQESESVERALRRFKRKVQRSGLYSELRKRRYYEKPSAQRKRKREAAVRRERRRQRRGSY